MTGIVTNLLDMARLQAGSLQLKRQWSLLEETVGAALAACKRVLARHPARVRLPADLPLLQTDAVLMERLFANLFENAAKYTPLDTPIEIGAERIVDDSRPFVRVFVDDHGPGLPAGMEARIFEKFTRGEKESATPGIGLGLAICRAIVDAHGGKIGALNRLGPDGKVEGARFWFTLPVDTPPPEPGAGDDAPDDEAGEAGAAGAAAGGADEAAAGGPSAGEPPAGAGSRSVFGDRFAAARAAGEFDAEERTAGERESGGRTAGDRAPDAAADPARPASGQAAAASSAPRRAEGAPSPVSNEHPHAHE